MNVGIGVRVGDKIYRLLQFIYPFEDIKNIDISSQYVSVSLNDFLVDPNVADALEMSEDMQKSIELMIKIRLYPKIVFKQLSKRLSVTMQR